MPTKKSASTSRKATETPADVAIDFPKEDETVAAGHYAVRITAPLGWDVEISTGDAAWFPCRESVGLYWFDWWPSTPGEATLTVRVRADNGKWKTAAERACTVAPGGTN